MTPMNKLVSKLTNCVTELPIVDQEKQWLVINQKLIIVDRYNVLHTNH